MNTIGIYAGTFDPLTVGHMDIIKRSLRFCDNLIIGVGNNSAKKTLLDYNTRIMLINKVLDNEFKSLFVRQGITVFDFQGLLVNFAKEREANLLIRGIRSVSDFEYEINLSSINKTLHPEIETVFLPTSPDLAVVSSSMVKEIAKYGGDVSPFVHPFVRHYLESMFAKD
jgi:pantetheine-phosphate adenylyltransferase